jgi:uncharacterized membrane protein
MLKQRLLCIKKHTNFKILSWILGFFFFFFFLNSCTIQNRIYMKGVSINQRPLMSHTIKKQKLNLQKNEDLITSRSNTIPLSIREKSLSNFLSNKKTLLEGDSVRIELYSGAVYEGVITKNSFDGYFIKIENKRKIYISNIEIKEIQYLNNEKDSNDTIQSKTRQNSNITKGNYINDDYVKPIENENNYYKNNDSNSTNEFNAQEAKIDPYALIGFFTAILGFFTGFSFIVSIIFSIMSLKRIKENPVKYKGKGFAIAGLTISIAVFLLSAILLAVFISWFI